MKQKVNVARALVHNPPVIFLDEPTHPAFDVISARAVRDFVEGAKRDGRCVILSTHVMDESGEASATGSRSSPPGGCAPRARWRI